MRVVALVAALVTAVFLVAGAWDDPRATGGDVSIRVFLVGWAAAAVIFVGFPLADALYDRGRSAFRPAALAVVLHVTAGFVMGLAVGTTDWTSSRPAGWRQLWWAVPLLLGYAENLITLRRSSGTRP